MINLFITAAKYIQLLLIVLYTYCNFRYLSIPDQEDADPLCDWQLRIILLVHFLMNCIIYLKTADMSAVWFYLLQLAFFLLYTFGAQRIYRNINRLLLNNVSVVGVGWGAFWMGDPGYVQEQWRDLQPLLERGALDPVGGAVHDLRDAAAAFTELDERRATGKVLLRVR